MTDQDSWSDEANATDEPRRVDGDHEDQRRPAAVPRGPSGAWDAALDRQLQEVFRGLVEEVGRCGETSQFGPSFWGDDLV